MTVEFDAAGLLPLEEGWQRDFILYSDGWDKDGDINTLFSQTVGPLPFHDMSALSISRRGKIPTDPKTPSLSTRVQYTLRNT